MGEHRLAARFGNEIGLDGVLDGFVRPNFFLDFLPVITVIDHLDELVASVPGQFASGGIALGFEFARNIHTLG